MSKNSKQANKAALAKQFSKKKGPASTAKKHHKTRTWYNASSPTFWRKPKEKKVGKDDAERAGLEFLRALKEEIRKNERTRSMRDGD
jgi:hypothetical protein